MFNLGKFTSHAGLNLDWKIECDDLTEADWECLAFMASKILPAFGHVEGIPTGGLKFASALQPYATYEGQGTVLIADDVYTTGKSMREAVKYREVIGVVAFARAKPEYWIYPIFQLK